MMKSKRFPFLWRICVIVATVFANQLSAQEFLAPLSSNLHYYYSDLRPTADTKPNTQQQRPTSSLFLPFIDDFHYADVSGYPTQNLWTDKSVYVNQGFGINPPSIGVATFDGLNQHGYPYDASGNPNLNTNGPSDTLTSVPINLFIASNSQTLTPADSVGLSFYYQARGNGDTPEPIDSLLLDFYNPTQQAWVPRVWFAKGNSNPNTLDTEFKRAFVMLQDPDFFKDGFRFRFRNKATRSGNFDHWHIDYVYLNNSRSTLGDTVYNDVTFGYVPTSFLRDYNAMPFEQFNSGEMSKSNSVLLRNNNTSTLNIIYENRFYDQNQQQVYFYSAQANNIPPYKTGGYYSNYAFSNPASHPTFTYTYNNGIALSDSVDFKIKHYIYRTGTNTDFIAANDTVYQYQRFRNYYACDDGAPEAGYYVLGTAGQMAQRFRVNYTDTLQSVRIYFDPAPLGSAGKFKFKIKLYSGSNLPVNLVYSSDTITMYPKFYNVGFKELPEYACKVLLNPGTYFIGIEQQLATGLVVGFDKNTETNGAVVYNSGGGWNTSTYKGALMIRPVFGKKILPPVGIAEQKMLQAAVKVYPNPASQQFTIENNADAVLKFELRNQLGQFLRSGTLENGSNTITCYDLPSGLYFLSISNANTATVNYKVLLTN